MITIQIKTNLKDFKNMSLKYKEKLNEAIHNAGFILEGAVKTDIATFPSVDTGRFLSSVQTDIGTQFQTSVFTSVPYARFLEYGTSPHFIKPTSKDSLAWRGGGEWFFSKGHMVRGIAPRRHFTRTAETMTPVMQDYIANELANV